MIDTDKQIKYYLPATCQIGKGPYKPKTYYYGPSEPAKISEIAFPSCRFKLDSWTLIGTFERISGYRPTNMVDKSKEISKMVTGSVFEIDNVPTRGFKILDNIHHDIYDESRYISGDSRIILEDPRGFNIQVPGNSLLQLIISNKISIIDNVIDAEFVYMWPESWSNPGKADDFILVNTNDEIYTNTDNVITEESIRKTLEDNPGIRTKDLVEGTVYDYVKGDKTKRVLFLGRRDVIKHSSVTTFLSAVGRFSLNYYIGKIDGDNMSPWTYNDMRNNLAPWSDREWIDLTTKGLIIEKNKPVFLELHEHSGYSYCRNLSLEHFVNGTDYDNTINLVDNVLNISGGKAIRQESKRQDIMILDEPKSYSFRINHDYYKTHNFEYKLYTYKQVSEAFTKSQKFIMNSFETYKKMLSTSQPYDRNKWISGLIDEYKRNEFLRI